MVFSLFIGVYVFIGVILTVMLIFVNGILVEGQVINFSVMLEGVMLSGGKVRINFLGQVLVVLISNKVGIYMVIVFFYNGVIIQIQIIVKVIGNLSIVYVVSFIVDLSIIVVINIDLSILKVMVEDGSGNLIEGFIVYFVLKSGFVILMLLIVVID